MRKILNPQPLFATIIGVTHRVTTDNDGSPRSDYALQLDHAMAQHHPTLSRVGNIHIVGKEWIDAIAKTKHINRMMMISLLMEGLVDLKFNIELRKKGDKIFNADRNGNLTQAFNKDGSPAIARGVAGVPDNEEYANIVDVLPVFSDEANNKIALHLEKLALELLKDQAKREDEEFQNYKPRAKRVPLAQRQLTPATTAPDADPQPITRMAGESEEDYQLRVAEATKVGG